MPFTEFYCDASTGVNINAGDLTANGVVTSTNGAWSTTTNTFTATSGTPFSGVSVGDFASIYTDAAAVTGYVARVTAVGGGGLTLTLSATAKSGTAPTTAATGISCTTGGAWKGPNGTVAFPFAFADSTMTNAAGDKVRVNLKNNATYSITAAISHTLSGVEFWGYGTTVGDGGRALIDGGTSGAAYAVLTLSGTVNAVYDIRVENNGATGEAALLTISGDSIVVRCVVAHSRGHGFLLSGVLQGIECEAYDCNLSNTASRGGISTTTSVQLLRCIAHHNSGSNTDGFFHNSTTANTPSYQFCISFSNGRKGFTNSLDRNGSSYLACDAYDNGSDGFFLNSNSTSSVASFHNCNAVKNGGYGINLSNYTTIPGLSALLLNCGYGAGTQANTSGDASLPSSVVEIGKVTYPSNVTPWVDPANGDFRISLTQAKGAGRGMFTQIAAGYAGTIGYPDIGAAQHLETAGGSGLAHIIGG